MTRSVSVTLFLFMTVGLFHFCSDDVFVVFLWQQIVVHLVTSVVCWSQLALWSLF